MNLNVKLANLAGKSYINCVYSFQAKTFSLSLHVISFLYILSDIIIAHKQYHLLQTPGQWRNTRRCPRPLIVYRIDRHRMRPPVPR